MSDKQTFLGKKAYAFVPLIEQCVQGQGVSQQIIAPDHYSGKLLLQLTTVSGLHIGNGVRLDEQGKMINQTIRRNGKIIVPGSSVKGMIRSVAEAVSNSCAVKLPDYRLKELVKALPLKNRTACSDRQRLCPTCSIFGMAARTDSYRGKVKFGEFIGNNVAEPSIEMLPLQESPFKNYPERHDLFTRDRNYGNERLYYCRACDRPDCDHCEKQNYFAMIQAAGKNREMKFRGRKFYSGEKDRKDRDTNQKKTYHEFIVPGTDFYGEVVYHNLNKQELQLLIYALNLKSNFQMKLGYGKAFGYGKVQLSLDRIEDIRTRYLNTAGLSKEEVLQMGINYKEWAADDVQMAISSLERIMG